MASATRKQEQINELLAQLAALQQRLATVENQPANQNPVTASAPAPVYKENPFAGDVNPNSTRRCKSKFHKWNKTFSGSNSIARKRRKTFSNNCQVKHIHLCNV